jgi:hypothetical protein
LGQVAGSGEYGTELAGVIKMWGISWPAGEQFLKKDCCLKLVLSKEHRSPDSVQIWINVLCTGSDLHHVKFLGANGVHVYCYLNLKGNLCNCNASVCFNQQCPETQISATLYGVWDVCSDVPTVGHPCTYYVLFVHVVTLWTCDNMLADSLLSAFEQCGVAIGEELLQVMRLAMALADTRQHLMQPPPPSPRPSSYCCVLDRWFVVSKLFWDP